jgi:hypothetical protein
MIGRDNLQLPAEKKELGLFTCMLQSPVARKGIESLGVQVPETFKLVHNTDSDDPPDLFALGLGFECTEFPPDQSAIPAVHKQRPNQCMTIPGFSQTRGKIKNILNRVDHLGYDTSYALTDEISSLAEYFITAVISGPRSKDIPGNDVLLLDQRGDHSPPERAETAIRCVFQQRKLGHIRLVLLVRLLQRGTGHLMPCAVQMYP